MAIRGTYRHKSKIPVPQQQFTDRDRGLVCFYVIAKSLEFAFTRRGRFKVGEKKLKPLYGPVTMAGDNKKQSQVLPGWLIDTLEIVTAMRGLGWDFGRGVHIPPSTRPSERRAFLRATGFSIVSTFFWMEFYFSCLRLVPGAGTFEGGTIFLSHLPPFQRYAVSTAAHFAAGMSIMYGVALVHDVHTLIAVGLLNNPPSSWPPVHDNPWKARSLHEFWAKRWHQGLRRAFVVTGGTVGSWIAGNAGMVLGTFVMSGLFHELTTYSLDRGLDHRTTLFFVLQACGIILEKAWKMLTGRRVGGVFGLIWTMIFVLGFGQMFTDSWMRRGVTVIGPWVLPDELSPMKGVVWHALRIVKARVLP